MKKIVICLFICCIGMIAFGGPRDRRGGHRHHNHRGHRHHNHRGHRHHNDGLYIANGVLDIVGKGLRILNGPPQRVVVAQPVITQPVITQPVVQQPVVVQQQPVVVTPPTTQIIQVGGTNYVIYTDENGKRRAVPINN